MTNITISYYFIELFLTTSIYLICVMNYQSGALGKPCMHPKMKPTKMHAKKNKHLIFFSYVFFFWGGGGPFKFSPCFHLSNRTKASCWRVRNGPYDSIRTAVGGFDVFRVGFLGTKRFSGANEPWNGHAWAHRILPTKKKNPGENGLEGVFWWQFGTVRQKIWNEPWMDE